jgi:uncharacterized protein (DUF433 family)
MPSGPDSRVEPAWVARMREAGYDVRTGTEPGDLPENPEVAFSLPRVIHSDPKILGGTPVFVGTRVPLKNLIDYLDGGHPLEDFLDDFPGVTREQAVMALSELPSQR